LLALSVVACGRAATDEQSEIRYDRVELPPTSADTVSFHTPGDRIRNLDLSLLEDPAIDGPRKTLLRNLWRSTLAHDPAYIDSLKRTYEEARDPFRSIYRIMLMELLANAEEYRAILEDSLVHPAMGVYPVYRVLGQAGPLYRISYSTGSRQALNEVRTGGPGYVYLESMVNSVPAFGLFDTGADLSVVSHSFAERAGVERIDMGDAAAGTPNRLQVDFELGILSELVLDDVTLEQVPVLVFPDESLLFAGEQTDFIIGWPVISKLRVEIDLPERTYEASEPPNTSTGLNNFFWLGYPGLKLTSASGQRLLFGLDTGADDTNLKQGVERKIRLGETVPDSIGDVSAGGVVYKTIETVRDLSVVLGAYRLTFPSVGIYDDRDFFFIRQDGTIGADVFVGNRVILDYPNRHFEIVRN